MIERPSSKWPNCQVSWTYGHNERPGWRRSPPKPTWVRWEDHPEWKIPWKRTNKPLVANHLLSLVETTVSGTRLKKQGTSLHLFNFLHYFASLSSLKVQALGIVGSEDLSNLKTRPRSRHHVKTPRATGYHVTRQRGFIICPGKMSLGGTQQNKQRNIWDGTNSKKTHQDGAPQL